MPAADRPDDYVVVAMGDDEVVALAQQFTELGLNVRAVLIPADPSTLPLATARNAGASTALDSGADLLVFLDADCLPGADLLARYAAAAARTEIRLAAPTVLSGPVVYLPPAPAEGYRLDELPHLGQPHPARPAPPDGSVLRAGDLRLFWSLSFSMTAADWQRVGGFCADYRGYGGEDTDFGQTVAAAEGSLWWVGGAIAYHQHHPPSAATDQHVAAIVANANVFHRRWGWWPMESWLEDLAVRGLARYDPTAREWVTLQVPARA